MHVTAETSFVFDAIGTTWQIDTPSPLAAEMRARVLEPVGEFDRVWSRFRADSVVSRIAREAGAHELTADAEPLFALYQQLFEVTAGAVNPFVGDSLVALGYDAAYSLQPLAVVPAAPSPEIAELDGTVLMTREPVTIDIGAVGKGYLVDRVADVLAAADVVQYTIDASGDLLHAAFSPLRIGLEHPYDPSQAIGIAVLDGADRPRALCASAFNRRAWGDGLHHVIDGRTGMPTHEVVASWAVANDAATADGLATALFFTGPTELDRSFPGTSGLRMFTDGRVEGSPSFPGELFT